LVTLEATLAELEASPDTIARRGDLVELADLLVSGAEQADRDRETTWNIVNYEERNAITSARARLDKLKMQSKRAEARQVTAMAKVARWGRGILPDGSTVVGSTVHASPDKAYREIAASAADLEQIVGQLLERGWTRIRRVVEHWGAWVEPRNASTPGACIFLFDTVSGPLGARVLEICKAHNIQVAKFDIYGSRPGGNPGLFRADVEKMFRLAPQALLSKLLVTGDSNQVSLISLRELFGATEPQGLYENWSRADDLIDQRIHENIRELAANIMLASTWATKPVKLSPMTGFIVASLIGRTSSHQVVHPGPPNASNPVIRVSSRAASFLDASVNDDVALLAHQHNYRYVANALAGPFDAEILQPSLFSSYAYGSAELPPTGLRRLLSGIRSTVAQS
jgi:BMFP domain-containing protein YqiC